MAEVRTAVRTLRILEAFAEVNRPLSLSAMAEHLRMPVSSCHALLSTLRAEGYLYGLGDRRFYPTRKLLLLAGEIARHDPLVELLMPILETLRDETGETVVLASRQTDVMTYLAVVESRRPIRYVNDIGMTRVLHATALGRALLSMLDDGRLRRLLKQLDLSPVTTATITNRDHFMDEIDKGRRQGYHLARGEQVAGVAGVAIPFSLSGEHLALGVVGPDARIVDALDSHVLVMKATLGQIAEL